MITLNWIGKNLERKFYLSNSFEIGHPHAKVYQNHKANHHFNSFNCHSNAIWL